MTGLLDLFAEVVCNQLRLEQLRVEYDNDVPAYKSVRVNRNEVLSGFQFPYYVPVILDNRVPEGVAVVLDQRTGVKMIHKIVNGRIENVRFD